MATGTHTLLERITVGGAGAASVTFSSIPQTGYTDLKIMVSARTDRASTGIDSALVQFNSDATSANYSVRRLYGNGSTASSDTTLSGAFTDASTATASTFGNSEVYIPNAFGSSTKSYSIDGTQESNNATAYTHFTAGKWTGISAISSIKLVSETGANFVQYSTFYLYGIAAFGTTPTRAPKAVGGDIIQTDGTYWYHAFINTGAFVPATGLTCDVLVVAGGGGGGGEKGGGGGAGGYVYSTSQSFGSGTSHTTTVGSGGASATNGTNSNVTGGTLSLTAAIGGGYGTAQSGSYSTGGSGGGGPGYTEPNTAHQTGNGTGTSGQGNNGGQGYRNSNTYFAAGGGGGAGAVGTDATSLGVGGAGGVGINTYSSLLSAVGLGASGYVAGGGGGGGQTSSASGGSGGGGAGTWSGTGTAGTANTGGGGGGGGSGGGVGGAGGSGVIIIRYAV